MVLLVSNLLNGDALDKAVLDLAIVAFWGMARLSELTYETSSGKIPRPSSLLTSDVKFLPSSNGGRITLEIRGAKTCAPGELQRIQVQSLQNLLCPVQAVSRRLAEAAGVNTSLFGYYSNGDRIHLTKPVVCRRLATIWTTNGCTGITGHSFRVGGTSLRYALGVPTRDIMELGRWTSDCYKLYVREYSPEVKTETLGLFRSLNHCWTVSLSQK
jgi:hypothetical protein